MDKITVNFLKLNHIDNTYTNVMDFQNIQNRDSYFQSNVKKSFSLNLKDDPLITSITLPVNHTEINGFNYLFLVSENNKKLFFFILNYTHTTPNATTINIQLDAFTTYQFDFKLINSYVDRCHVARWNGDIPTQNTIDENISLSDYIQDSNETIYTYNNGLIIASTTPLGLCPDFNKPSEGGSPGSGENGLITQSGFRFLKGYEAFAANPLYMSGENFQTVGYGTIEQNTTYFNNHKPFPCSEQKASEIMAERLTNDFGKRLRSQLASDGIHDKITNNQFDALLSLCYNCGSNAALNDDTSPYYLIKRDPNNTHIREWWEKFYIKGGFPPVELPGLVARRKAEADIYCNNVYELRDILIAVDVGGGIGGYDGVVTDNNGNGFIPPILPKSKNIINIIQEV